jgi:hypothetical protein
VAVGRELHAVRESAGNVGHEFVRGAGIARPEKPREDQLESASIAVHVYTSPTLAGRASFASFALAAFSFIPTKLQISSHCTRFAATWRTVTSWKALHALPATVPSRAFFANRLPPPYSIAASTSAAMMPSTGMPKASHNITRTSHRNTRSA